MRKLLFLLILSSLKIQAQSYVGLWRAELETVAGKLPFHILIENKNNKPIAYFKNGKELLKLDKCTVKKDSVILKMDLFDAEIKAKIYKNKLVGIYTKRLANLSYRSSKLEGLKNDNRRFIVKNKIKFKIGSKYQLEFVDGKNKYDAVGIFNQIGNEVNGTFLTETGDYRYLQGNVDGDSLKLSCVDGNHIFMFKAKIQADSLVNGVFCYNFLGTEKWAGIKNNDAKIQDAFTLTYIKPGYDKLDFSFNNTLNKTISLSDEKYKNKVTVVQILGTWCPNCMDETKFLANYHRQNGSNGMEVIGVAFEKSIEESFAYPKLNRLKEKYDIKYEVLLGGKNDKADASDKFPMLNKIISFPTTIIIDKKGKVRHIHTGFSGPGTGKYYTEFVEEFDKKIRELIRE